MYKLGITGGIGSGKSTASNYLSQKPKVYVFNADKEAKKCLKKSLSLQHKLINIFGNNITEGGKLVLSKLAQVAFKDKINHKCSQPNNIYTGKNECYKLQIKYTDRPL